MRMCVTCNYSRACFGSSGVVLYDGQSDFIFLSRPESWLLKVGLGRCQIVHDLPVFFLLLWRRQKNMHLASSYQAQKKKKKELSFPTFKNNFIISISLIIFWSTWNNSNNMMKYEIHFLLNLNFASCNFSSQVDTVEDIVSKKSNGFF